MAEQELIARLETLEIRASHQEAAIEELTRSLLEQEKLNHEQAESIARLEAQVRALTTSPVAAREDETPPPHY